MKTGSYGSVVIKSLKELNLLKSLQQQQNLQQLYRCAALQSDYFTDSNERNSYKCNNNYDCTEAATRSVL